MAVAAGLWRPSAASLSSDRPVLDSRGLAGRTGQCWVVVVLPVGGGHWPRMERQRWWLIGGGRRSSGGRMRSGGGRRRSGGGRRRSGRGSAMPGASRRSGQRLSGGGGGVEDVAVGVG